MLRPLLWKSSPRWTAALRSIQFSHSAFSTLSSFTMPTTQRRGYTTSNVQFPELPKEWEGKYVKGQMYKYQESIPHLPVPPLEQTLKKYITGVQPLLTDEELEKTKKVVAEFGQPGGIGEELQRRLLKRAEERDSWLLEWWNEVAYLGFRESVAVHSNPAVGFPIQPHGDLDTYVKTVTKFILGVAKWNMIVQNHAVPPDVYRKRPLCMVQYDTFSKCRIPTASVDTARQTPFSESRHIIVLRNGHFYKLDIVYQCPDGSLAVAPASHIMSQLHEILKTAPASCEHPVGVLTTEHRDSWTETRQNLLLDPMNQSTLEAIETAQSVFCLDKSCPETNTTKPSFKYWDESKTMLANRYLHGNGCKRQTTNRWFDSAIQIFVGEDGGVGSNLEHSAADGVCAITIDTFALELQDIYDVLAEPSPVPTSSLQSFQPLKWNISPEVAADIETAKEKIDKLAGDVDLHVAKHLDFGKNFPKSMKLSPDGFIQNAILLTYYRMYNRMTSMYESGSTRFYKYGRTDTIRNTSNQAYAFVKSMEDPNASNLNKADALREAIKAHSNATVEAIDGQAFDRHLLGLRLIARDDGIEMPDMFKDYVYGKSLHFCLSTSQVPVPNYELFLCFGAVVPDGYGVCYNPQENQIIFSVSSFRSCPETDSIRFLEALFETMKDMRAVLIASKGVTAKL